MAIVDMIVSPMLAKLFAFILLLLAASPFNAPFQTGTGDQQHIASVETLSGIRQNSAARAVIAQRFATLDGMEIVSLDLTGVLPTDLTACVIFRTRTSASAGDYAPLAAILRL
jgi:hypothetical protein